MNSANDALHEQSSGSATWASAARGFVVIAVLTGVGYSFYRAAVSIEASTESQGAVSGKATTLANQLGITVSDHSLNLGRIPTHAHTNRTVVFTNPTKGEFRVDAIVASCGCTQVSPFEFTLASGQSQAVSVDIAADQHKGAGIKPFEVSLTLRSGSLRSDFRLTAIAYDAARPTAATIDFGQSLRLGEPAMSKNQVLLVEPEVQEVELSLPPAFGSIVNQRDTVINGDRRIEFQVQLGPITRIGHLACQVTVKAIVGGSEALDVRWPCAGAVESDIRFAPRTLILVSDPETDKLTATEFQVWSITGSRIDGLTVESPNFAAVGPISYSESTGKSLSHICPSSDVAPATQFGTVTIRGMSPQYGKEFVLHIPVTMPALSRRQSTL